MININICTILINNRKHDNLALNHKNANLHIDILRSIKSIV